MINKKRIAQWYRTNLNEIKKIRLIPIAQNCESATHLFQIRVDDRDKVMLSLNEHEIFPGVHYRDNTEYSMYKEGAADCPNAHQASKELISLPLHLEIQKQDVDLICDLIKQYTK